ncbi:MAG: hypothetical protein HDT14_00635 [Oscillibacter sp.]|nr:hypothetical protein [Oscillibacter sp.]
MVRLIMSGSGEGKTKQLIQLMENAAEHEVGCMVCIEPKRNMSFNIRHQTRLVDASEFAVSSFESLRGFVCGLYAGNYDISHIFIDDLCKVAHSSNEREIGEFLNWLDAFSSPLNLKVTITLSAAPDSATDTMRKYM